MTYGGVHSPQLLTAHKLQPVGFGTHEHCCYIANGSALEEVGYPAGAYARAVSGKAMTTQPDRQIGFFLTFHILAIA